MKRQETTNGETRGARALQRIRDAANVAADLREGPAMRNHADWILCCLPSGPIDLIATTGEGAALAAVVAASRTEPTSWRRVRLTLSRTRDESRVYVVEPYATGEGWRKTVLSRFPSA